MTRGMMGNAGEVAAGEGEGEGAGAVNLIPMVRLRVQSEILARAESFASPPDILALLQEKANDDSTEIAEIETLLRQDPALVTKLLRLVNSSFFALRYKVNNISHAVALVGFRTLRSLIYAAFADDIYRQEMPGYGYGRRGLWRHSVHCAFTARMLGLRGVIDRAEAEDLFVAGLLHDVGKLLLWPTLEARLGEFHQALQDTEGALLESERAVCGIDHTEVGALVARQWRLADSLVACIGHHHQPPGGAPYARQVAAVHLVNWVLTELRVGLVPEHRHRVGLDHAAVELLDLDRTAIDDLKCWLAQTGGREPFDE